MENNYQHSFARGPELNTFKEVNLERYQDVVLEMRIDGAWGGVLVSF